MKSRLSLRYSLDLLFALLALIAALAVLQTFIIGRHYIIPTGILVVAVLLGNIAWYGLTDHAWAKKLMFWCGFLLTGHALFALFWSKRYRELLGDAFEPVCLIVLLVLAALTVTYARSNRLFRR